MKTRLPILVQDQFISRGKGIPLVEGFDADKEDFFLDGPVTKQLAVIDFDPTSGVALSGAKFVPPEKGKVLGKYVDRNGNDLRDTLESNLTDPEFMQVSTFATVLRTIYDFERHEVLGRSPLVWASGRPQLFIVPRAGNELNAFYHRDSSSLQFFFGPSQKDPAQTIYTCLSRDIVIHETGHAIVDSIAPDLINASTPESLALHEALADLVALFGSATSRTLVMAVLEQTNGSIQEITSISSLAEELGEAIGHIYGLRNLNNDKGFDRKGGNNYVSPAADPHDVSEVFSGALFSVLEKLHELLKKSLSVTKKYADKPDPLFSSSGEALNVGAVRLQRVLFRGLDVLPPGENSFADLARAMIAVDQIAYPSDDTIRKWIVGEFTSRKIVRNKSELKVNVGRKSVGLSAESVQTLFSSNWAAHNFVDMHPDLFGIGRTTPFEIRSRLHVKKKYEQDQLEEECIFKVTWYLKEDNPIGGKTPTQRAIRVGSTMILDWKTGELLAVLSNAPRQTGEKQERQAIARPNRPAYERQRKARDLFLSKLVRNGDLALDEFGLDMRGKPLLNKVQARTANGIMRVSSTGNMLHILRD